MKNTEAEGFHRELFERIPETKRDRLLAVAIEEFSEHGLSDANINHIAKRSGISIGSLYQYFASKDDLYLTVVQYGLSALEEALNPILESKKTALEKIECIIDTIFEKTQQQKSLTRLYNRFTSEGNSELARTLASRLETMTAHAYARLLLQAKKEGSMDKNADEQAFAFCMDNIFLILQFSLSSEYYRDRLELYMGKKIHEEQDRLKNTVMAFIRNALGGKKT